VARAAKQAGVLFIVGAALGERRQVVSLQLIQPEQTAAHGATRIVAVQRHAQRLQPAACHALYRLGLAPRRAGVLWAPACAIAHQHAATGMRTWAGSCCGHGRNKNARPIEIGRANGRRRHSNCAQNKKAVAPTGNSL